MAATLAGCRKASVGTGLGISLLLAQTGVDKASLPFKGLHIWHCRKLSVWRSICWSEDPDHCKITNERS